jgi:ribosomal protein S7
MKNNNLDLKKKWITLLMKNGNKKTCEIITLKSLKKLQKLSTKQLKNIIKLSVLNSTPIFKIQINTNKKQKKKNRKIRVSPIFINRTKIRTSSALKYIIATLKTKQNCYLNLQIALLTAAKNEGIVKENKTQIQHQALINKHYFKYYNWMYLLNHV